MFRRYLYLIKLSPILYFVFLLSPGNVWSMTEYFVEISTDLGTHIYAIPIGQPTLDEFGRSVYSMVTEQTFYVKENSNVIYPDSKTAAELYAASQAMAHLYGYPFLDSSNQLSEANAKADDVVQSLTSQQKNEAIASTSASVFGGVCTSWTLGVTICGTSALTGIGAVPGCIGGAVVAVGGTVLTISDTIATAYSEGHNSAQTINAAQNAYFAGNAFMNEGFKIQVTEVEPVVNKTNDGLHPAKIEDIAYTYRRLGLIASLYQRALERFEDTGMVNTKSMIKRVVGAWGVGAIPGGSTTMGFWEYFKDGESLSVGQNAIITDITTEQTRIEGIDIFAAPKQEEYRDYFASAWGVIEPPLPDINISLSITARDTPGKMRIIVNHQPGVKVKDLFSYRYNFGDGQGIISEKGVNGVSVPTTLVDYTYAENGQYTVSVEFTSIDNRKSEASMTINVDHAPVDVEYSPSARRISPDYSTDHIVGEEVIFNVRGFDVDSNLSHVVWTFDGPIELLESDNIDYFDSSENQEGYEKITARIIGDNGGNHFQMYATVYDDLGNASDPVKWNLEARQSHAPVFSSVTPPAGNVEVALGEKKNFSFIITDTDNNAGSVHWVLNNEEVYVDGVDQGDPPTGTDYNFQVYARAVYQLRAEIEDEDGNKEAVEWQITAGTPLDGNLAPQIDQLGLAPYEFPYNTFRVGKGYKFKVTSSDIDGNLIAIYLYLNDILVNERLRNSGTTSDDLSAIISFPSAGTYTLKAIAVDQNSAQTEKSLVITVLEADGTEGTPPRFTSIFPSSSAIYVPPGENLTLGGTFFDNDWDADHIEVYINNVKVYEYDISGDSSFDFSVNSSLLPTSGTHQLKVIPIDAGGKIGDAKSWSLVIGQGNHAPQIRRSIPNSSDPIYALTDGSTSPTLYVFVEDQDGDLDRVVFNMSGVGDPDPTDERWVGGFFDVANNGFIPTKNGLVTVTVYDKGGRSSSTNFSVTIVDQFQNHPPEILNCNIPDGGVFDRVTNDSHYWIALEFDAFDPDGDLLTIELFKNDIIIAASRSINDYEDDSSFLSNGYETVFDSFEGPDINIKGDKAEFLLRLTDANNNVTEKTWIVTQGPTGEKNHSPVVDEIVDISLKQFGSAIFEILVFDEDGDTPSAVAVGLPTEHNVSYLGDGKFLYTPALSFHGEIQFNLLWSDGFGGSATTLVKATVDEVTASLISGDINNDGEVALDDLIVTLRILTNSQFFETVEKSNANNGTQVQISDAISILDKLAEAH